MHEKSSKVLLDLLTNKVKKGKNEVIGFKLLDPRPNCSTEREKWKIAIHKYI